MKQTLFYILVIVLFVGIMLQLKAAFPNALQSEGEQANFAKLSIIMVLILGGMRIIAWQDLFHKIKHLLVWVALFIVFIFAYAQKDILQNILMPQSAKIGADNSLIFTRAADGHFHIDAQVNNVKVQFMVDTGASDIVLSPADAERIGINMAQLSFNKIYQTANGIGRGASITLDTLQVGSIIFHDVAASTNQAAMSSSLLGMSYINRLGRVELQGDKLIIWAK